MKQTFIALLVGATTLSFGACNNKPPSHEANQNHEGHTHSTAGSTSSEPTGNEMQRIMDSMMGKMHNMEMSGDPDRDFAEMMIVHHQGAVDMARAELASGKDTAMRNMATAIIGAQEREIADMRRIISTLPEAPAAEKLDHASSPLMKSMSGMMASGHGTQLTGDVDKDFVRMMVPHHEGAVEMAKVQIQQGRNSGLKRMAQKMVDDQTREIGQFRQWLAANP